MIREMAKDNKGAPPDMGDLSDVNAFFANSLTVMMALEIKIFLNVLFLRNFF